MAKTKHATFVDGIYYPAGSDLDPDLVGEHLFTEEKVKEKPSKKKTGIPSVPREEVEEVVLERPSGNGSKLDWEAYADAIGVDYPEEASRDDIKALVEEFESKN